MFVIFSISKIEISLFFIKDVRNILKESKLSIVYINLYYCEILFI